MNRYDPTAEIRDLATFDADEFSTMCAVSRFIQADEKATVLHLLAIHHTDEAEGLLSKAVGYLERGNAVAATVGQEMFDGVKIRLAAAAHCRRLSASYAAFHAETYRTHTPR